MVKTATIATRSPRQFATSYGIFFEDLRMVEEMLNYAFQNNVVQHVSAQTGGFAWGNSGSEIATHATTFDGGGGGFDQVYKFRIHIDDDTTSLLCGAICEFAGAGVGDVRFTVGGNSTIIVFDNSDNGNERTATLATSATGTGWQTCTVEIDQTTGDPTSTNELRYFRIEDVLPPLLPDPVIGYVCIVVDNAGVPVVDNDGRQVVATC